MKRNLYRIGLAATLALGLVPAAASAEVLRFQFQGNSAHAVLSSTDSTGCISTGVSVHVYENRFQQPPGPPQQVAALDVFVLQYDYCQNIYLFQGGGSATLPTAAFAASRSLHSASLTASVDVNDWFSGAQMPVAIDLGWTGVGDVDHGSSRYQSIYPNFKSMSRSTGSSREAEVTGTGLFGNTNLAASGSWGSLAFNQTGYLTVWR